ncbi:MAG: GGDEF domain-containing protein [Acidobacteriia bacterium]|nr:GGDEF domain-containing protein [Terriglobia bacterium]
MDKAQSTRNLFAGSAGLWLSFAMGGGIFALSWWLRTFSAAFDPLFFRQLQFTSGILAITFAAAALVRFRGTRERLPLILACGFVITGLTLASSSFFSFRLSDSRLLLRDPVTWVMDRTLLGLLLVSALVVERRLPRARNPGREIVAALILVVLSASLLSVAHARLPAGLVVHPGRAFPRPGNLLPAALFLLATIGYHRRLRHVSSPFDLSLYFAASLNLWCSLAASQSERPLDGTSAVAGMLQFGSYAVMLGGTLLDDIRLFEKVRLLAVSDSLTGLANYRRLVEVLEAEIERAKRTGRNFALVLFDVDGLKKINDQFGHLTGTRALCRVAAVLRAHSRAIDTGARHGGDEFALVLPETGAQGAAEVALRICDHAAHDEETPAISISAGFAVYPQDGDTIEKLLSTADGALYRMKKQDKGTAPVEEPRTK